MSVAGLENEVSAVFGVDTTLASADVGLNLIGTVGRSRRFSRRYVRTRQSNPIRPWSVTFFSLPPKAA